MSKTASSSSSKPAKPAKPAPGPNGKDSILGGNGDDRLSGGNGTDTILAGAGNDTLDGGNGVDLLDGQGGNDLLLGGNGDDVLLGGDGDDVLQGGHGNDRLDGGAGADTVVVTGNLADYTLSGTASAFTLSGDGATDTVAGVESVAFADGTYTTAALFAPVKLYDGSTFIGGYETVQAAVDAADPGWRVEVSGDFSAENVAVAEGITLQGVGGSGAKLGSVTIAALADASVLTIDGFTFADEAGDVAIRYDGDYADTTAVTLNLRNLTVQDYGQNGIAVFGGGPGLTVNLIDSSLTGNGDVATSGGAGEVLFYNFTGDVAMRGVTMTGTTGTTPNADGVADHGISFGGYDGDSFSAAATLVNRPIGNVTFEDVTVSGTYGKTLLYVHGYNDLAGLDVSGLTLGSATGTATGWTGLYVDPALGISSANFTPAADGVNNLSLDGLTVEGGAFGWGLSNLATGTRGADAYVGSADTNVMSGGAGDDVFTGAGGDDYLIGEAGVDTAVYAGTIDASMVTAVADADGNPLNGAQAGWRVTSGAEGTDALVAVEVVDDGGSADASEIHLVGNGGFATIGAAQGAAVSGGLSSGDAILSSDGGRLVWNGTAWDATAPANTAWLFDASGNFVSSHASIQAAVDAASAGFTISVGAGTFNGNVTLNKAVTLLGVNEGIAGAAARGAESVIVGKVTVTAGATLDGFKVLNASSGTAAPQDGIEVQSLGAGATVSLVNNVIWASNANGADTDRAIDLWTSVAGTVVIDGNLISGDSTGLYGTASWNRGIWSDGRNASLTITDNTIQYARTGVNLDFFDGTKTTVSGNTFANDGSGISIGVNAVNVTMTGITGNTFDNVDTDFNLQNLPSTAPVMFDLGATGNMAGAGQTTVVLGGAGADAISGTDGADYLVGNAGADVLAGGAGIDLLVGGAGNDAFVFDTSADGDTIADFTSGSDVLVFDDAAFAGLIVGNPAQAFADGLLAYDAATGVLSYDADGMTDGMADGVAVVTLTGLPSVTAADVTIV